MNPCFASQLRGRAQTFGELVRLGTQMERDFDLQRRYNQVHLCKNNTLDQNSQFRKIKEEDRKAILPLEQRNLSLLCWRCHENHSPGSCPNFKAALSGKHSGGQAQNGEEFQGHSHQRGVVSAYDTQRLVKNPTGSRQDKRVGPVVLRQLVVPLTVRNCTGKALVDTGATYTLHFDLWNKIKGHKSNLMYGKKDHFIWLMVMLLFLLNRNCWIFICTICIFRFLQ